MLFATSSLIAIVLAALPRTLAAAVPRTPAATTATSVKTIFEYPKGTWLENIAVRQNGNLLLTSLVNPGDVHELDPFNVSQPALVGKIPNLNSTGGITEAESDVFYVIASNSTFGGTMAGSDSIFQVNFNTGSNGLAAVTKLVGVPNAKLLNGLTHFNSTLLLAADSGAGAVWAINTVAKTAAITIQDPLMAPNMTGGFGGINGLHFRGNQLFFTSSDKNIVAKVQLDANGKAVGPAVVVGHGLIESGVQSQLDDFTIDPSGNFFVSAAQGHTVQMITPQGQASIVAGSLNSTQIAQPTAMKFGRTAKDANVLYVTTPGGLGAPVIQNGMSVTIGAQVVAVNLTQA